LASILGFFSYWVFHLSLLGLTSLFTNALGDFYLCYIVTQVGIYGSWVSPFLEPEITKGHGFKPVLGLDIIFL
jgi:hypothetical protein